MSTIKFPIYNIPNIPEALRKMANDIEDGSRPAEFVVVCIQTPEGKSDYGAFGTNTFWMAAVGLLQVVSTKITKQMDI